MSEGEFVTEIEKGIEIIDSNAHISKVESHLTAAGIPDFDFCFDGAEGHMEIKFSGDKNAPHIRPSQVKWFKKRAKAGGCPWLFAKLRVNNNWCYALFSPIAVPELAVTKKSIDWIRWTNNMWTGKMTKRDWFNFYNIVRDKKWS